MDRLKIILPILFLIIAGFGAYFFVIPWISSQPVRQIEKKTTTNIPEGEKIKRTLYFCLDDRLASEEREIILKKDDFATQVKDVLRELIKGPVNDLRLTPLIPEETKIKSIFLDNNGICYLNFNREIQEKFPGGTWTELLSLYSIANTVIENFPEIRGVQILVEGYSIETLSGHIDARYPFQRREDLVGQ